MILAFWQDSGTMEEIDMVIGPDFYWSLVTGKAKMGKTVEQVAIGTKFGWVLSEPLLKTKSLLKVMLL